MQSDYPYFGGKKQQQLTNVLPVTVLERPLFLSNDRLVAYHKRTVLDQYGGGDVWFWEFALSGIDEISLPNDDGIMYNIKYTKEWNAKPSNHP